MEMHREDCSPVSRRRLTPATQVWEPRDDVTGKQSRKCNLYLDIFRAGSLSTVEVGVSIEGEGVTVDRPPTLENYLGTNYFSYLAWDTYCLAWGRTAWLASRKRRPTGRIAALGNRIPATKQQSTAASWAVTPPQRGNAVASGPNTSAKQSKKCNLYLADFQPSCPRSRWGSL